MTRLARLWPFAVGALAGFGQAPWGLWSVTLIACVIVLSQWHKTLSWRASFALGWLFGLGYFGVTLSWLIHPFLVDPLAHAWLIPFALLAMCGWLSLLWAAAFALARRFEVSTLGLASFWGAAELLRGYLFTGFPWGLPGYIWLDTPVAQLSSLIGPYGLTLLTFVLCALLVETIRHKSQLWGLAASIGFVVSFALGFFLLSQSTPDGTGKVLRLVQPNAPQHQKWDPNYIPVFYERALSLSTPQEADLVIWPETALAVTLNNAEASLTEISDVVGEAHVLLGLNRVAGYRGYNSAALIDETAQVQAVYDKHHLVPFGEYLPFEALLSRVGLSAMTAKEGYGYSSGEGPEVMAIEGFGQALPLICYEAIFPRDLRSEARADWLVQLTNDAWFGTRAGPYQSLAQSRFRSIETGLPMVRAANTGVSAVIDAKGFVTASTPLGNAGAIEAELPAAMAETPYARFGETVVILALLAGLMSSLALRNSRKS